MAARRYTKFLFECLQNEKRNSVSPSDHVIFFLWYKTIIIHNDVFSDFPKISHHFAKISEDSPKVVRRQDERFWKFYQKFRTFPKIAEDCRGWIAKYFRRTSEDISIIHQHI